MPAIKPRTKQKHLVRHITQLFRENNDTLFAYATFIGESTGYVLNELVATVLAKDRDFLMWLETHPGPHTPVPGNRRSARRAPRVHVAVPDVAAPADSPRTARP
jgi:hypothetical protein